MKASASQQQGLVVQQASEVAQLRATAQAHATELEDMRTHRSASRDWAQLAQASGEKADRANESIRELVDRLRSEHQAEAARLRDAAEEGRALLDSRAAELQGFIRSVDREQAQGLEKARAWQAEADSRMSRLAEELGHAASEWRTDLQACRRALEGQLAVGLRETREEHRSAHGAALAEVAEVDRRGAACAAELHRLHVAAEKRTGLARIGVESSREERLGDLDELAKATARLDRALPLELEKSAGELRRLQAEASAALSGEIRSLETSFFGRCQSLEQQLSRGVELAQRADGLDACGDELRRGLASASREAADRARADQEAAAAQLEETASCVHQRLDDLAAVMEESRQQAQDDAARALAEAEARLERRCAEAEELGRVLRGDLEASQSDSKAAVADAKAELSRRRRLLKGPAAARLGGPACPTTRLPPVG
ncbi:unnamed protein product [Prorocentrum cordatum]|uniref:Uncharacterized protein n=1 Tax=Prorocentrum cordatum TaxID=2364126 RepID=A0ABN9Q8K9_9DINO|nr:unnamed protein product [Polarella glacialis]